jgi:phage replication initiation protein
LRYGNKLRELSAEMLRRPADFFGGASDWHASILLEHGAQFAPEPVRIRQVQAVQTVKAEVTRAVRWLSDTASQSLALAFQFLGNEEFIELVSNRNKPGRLRRFGDQEIKAAFSSLSPKIYQPRATGPLKEKV